MKKVKASSVQLQNGVAYSAFRRSKAEPITPSKRIKKAEPQVAVPQDGYMAICIDGPMKGMQTRVYGPNARVLAPMSNDPVYYCAIYRSTDKITGLGEIACVFSHLLKRPNK
jgi:hypothetical protein